jgi:phage gpG-like protein
MFSLDFEDFGVAADLSDFGDDLDNLSEALELIIRKVIQPAFATNFQVGGRPAWPPLSIDTVHIKGNAEPLIATGRLYSGSQAMSSWNIDNDTAQFSGAAGADYGIYHQEGTRRMPQREWASITPEDEDKAEETMVEWIGEKLGSHGFGVFTSSFSAGDF